ncbi:MAG: MerR family transcriptional regulator [Rickettsiales bacterium]|jgi:DNA-binding transcriptional MerR regulator|nr:MerR family transcriptional regulator [Rickettsiales bacterium]
MTEPFLSINEVSKRLDIPAHTLRYWEKQFPTAVKPATGAGGRRYYRAETVGALSAIRGLLYDKGMTIAGVKKIIKEGGLERAEIEERRAEIKDNNSSTESSLSEVINLLEKARAELA